MSIAAITSTLAAIFLYLYICKIQNHKVLRKGNHQNQNDTAGRDDRAAQNNEPMTIGSPMKNEPIKDESSMSKEDLLQEAAETRDVYEIDYKNNREECRRFHISHVEKREPHCIKAYCHETSNELVFNISQIETIRRYWIDILDENELVQEDGLYLFFCRGDNHFLWELHYLRTGERFYKYFEGDYIHYHGWFHVIPLSYLKIPFYNPDNPGNWIPTTEIELNKVHKAIVAFQGEQIKTLAEIFETSGRSVTVPDHAYKYNTYILSLDLDPFTLPDPSSIRAVFPVV